ncbi:MAG: nitroreductase family protein [Chloroflexi bacterium]|nr:nitroreductase family protein [Chloroflexota bacterium]
MSFLELARKRYSVRTFKQDPVEDAKLNEVLEAAQAAPTAANRQPFQLVIVHTAGKETELARINSRPGFVQAPLLIFAVAVPSQAWVHRDGKNYMDVDIAIVMDHLTLAATDLGLGTCWIAAFDRTAAREFLGLPPDVEPIVVTPLGYPAPETPREKKRKSMAELVRYERW